jgi:hypothetical protein
MGSNRRTYARLAYTRHPTKPPNLRGLPHSLQHVTQYAMEQAYVTPRADKVITRHYKQRVYNTMKVLQQNSKDNKEMRIVPTHPGAAWYKIWENLHRVMLPDPVISTWYTVIHDILPTKERLAEIQIAPTNVCAQCGNLDTPRHRIVTCKEGRVMWSWTRARVADILTVHPSSICADWTLRPDFHFWRPQRHAATLWIIARLVYYRMQASHRIAMKDYMDFLRRAIRKLKQRPTPCQQTGRHLDFLG